MWETLWRKRSVYRDLRVRQTHLFDLGSYPVGGVHIGQGTNPHAVNESTINGRIDHLHRSEISGTQLRRDMLGIRLIRECAYLQIDTWGRG